MRSEAREREAREDEARGSRADSSSAVSATLLPSGTSRPSSRMWTRTRLAPDFWASRSTGRGRMSEREGKREEKRRTSKQLVVARVHPAGGEQADEVQRVLRERLRHVLPAVPRHEAAVRERLVHQRRALRDQLPAAQRVVANLGRRVRRRALVGRATRRSLLSAPRCCPCHPTWAGPRPGRARARCATGRRRCPPTEARPRSASQPRTPRCTRPAPRSRRTRPGCTPARAGRAGRTRAGAASSRLAAWPFRAAHAQATTMETQQKRRLPRRAEACKGEISCRNFHLFRLERGQQKNKNSRLLEWSAGLLPAKGWQQQ